MMNEILLLVRKVGSVWDVDFALKRNVTLALAQNASRQEALQVATAPTMPTHTSTFEEFVRVQESRV